jgi:PAS domain S-box-containing protein
MARDGWAALFVSAFRQSKNPMVLVDDGRRIVEANAAFVRMLGRRREALLGHHVWEFVSGGPIYTPAEWRDALAQGHFAGAATMLHADGTEIAVQWAAHTEVATGRRLVLFAALNTSRWGNHFRRHREHPPAGGKLSARELEVVRLVARGETGPEIAAELGIAHETVRTHVRNAMTKLDARSRAHLVAKVLGEPQLHLSQSAGP